MKKQETEKFRDKVERKMVVSRYGQCHSATWLVNSAVKKKIKMADNPKLNNFSILYSHQKLIN